jgi:hypothetical protein
LQITSGSPVQQRINVAELPGGIYLLTVIDEKRDTHTTKVIIAR